MSNEMKSVAYVRVSTLLNQDPSTQVTAIHEFALRRGLRVTADYVDHGISGVREKRPALDKLVSDAKMGRFKIVIVTGIDRLTR